MNDLGLTRSVRRPDHLLQTPDTFVRAPLPGMKNATAIVHAAPTLGAGFTQYTAELEKDGTLGPTTLQRFVYVLEGALQTRGTILQPGGFAYYPTGSLDTVQATAPSRCAVIEKPYIALTGVSASQPITGQEENIPAQPLNGDPALEVRSLLPSDPAFDLAVNTMTYQPGASLSMVEVHVMEHGLLMLEGAGIYRLGEHWYPVAKGDFIWMASFCPQWFAAIGKTPAKYLIYKDWNR